MEGAQQEFVALPAGSPANKPRASSSELGGSLLPLPSPPPPPPLHATLLYPTQPSLAVCSTLMQETQLGKWVTSQHLVSQISLKGQSCMFSLKEMECKEMLGVATHGCWLRVNLVPMWEKKRLHCCSSFCFHECSELNLYEVVIY